MKSVCLGVRIPKSRPFLFIPPSSFPTPRPPWEPLPPPSTKILSEAVGLCPRSLYKGVRAHTSDSSRQHPLPLDRPRRNVCAPHPRRLRQGHHARRGPARPRAGGLLP